jgi:DNA modification methylase
VQPYYQDSHVTLYHGDCRDVLPHVGKAALVLTDPPYNAINRATAGLRTIDKGGADSTPVDVLGSAPLLSAIAPSVYVWCSDEQYTDWTMAFKGAGSTTRICAWWKTNPSPMNGQHLWLSALELCVFARRRGAVFNGHCQHPVWRGPIAKRNGHPTPKPNWLMRIQLARRAVGVEIDERYCEIAAQSLRETALDGA